MRFEHNSLSNNLAVVTYEMPYLRTVSINFIVGVGSRYESEGEEGISHFLEHMAFKGTYKRSARQIAEEFDSIGGQFNAYTSKEHTVYYAKVLDIHAEKALEILSDIILNSKFDNIDIEKEKQVIEQEIAQMYDNPDELAYEYFVQKAFENQSLGKSILGTVNTIKDFDSTSFKKFVSKYYSSGNCVLSIAGNIDTSTILKSAEEKFGKLNKNQRHEACASNYIGGTKIVKKDLEQANIYLGFQGYSYNNFEAFYTAQIYSLIFGGGISSRLFQKIREKEGLAYSVGSFNTSFSDSGIFSIYAATSNDKVTYVIDKIIDEINYSIEKITEEELNRAKLQIESCILMAEEKTAFKSEEIGKNYILFNRFISPEEILSKVKDIDLKSIRKVAENIFKTNPTLSILSSNNPQINQEYITKKIL